MVNDGRESDVSLGSAPRARRVSFGFEGRLMRQGAAALLDPDADDTSQVKGQWSGVHALELGQAVSPPDGAFEGVGNA